MTTEPNFEPLTGYLQEQERRRRKWNGAPAISEEHYISYRDLQSLKAIQVSKVRDLNNKLLFWRAATLLMALMVIGESIKIWLGGS